MYMCDRSINFCLFFYDFLIRFENRFRLCGIFLLDLRTGSDSVVFFAFIFSSYLLYTAKLFSLFPPYFSIFIDFQKSWIYIWNSYVHYNLTWLYSINNIQISIDYFYLLSSIRNKNIKYWHNKWRNE
jgi:hypothetical protein